MQQPDSFTMQKEADLTDFFDPNEFPIEQVIVFPPEPFDALSERGGSKPGVLTPRGRRPGSYSYPPMLDYPVQFPLGRPTSDNLQAICLHGDHRPRYPDSYFPRSGFGQLVRRAGAVNKAESWFSTCCKGNQTWEREVTLCCATQAWELSVQSFCEEDSSVKDRLYHCCRLKGSKRLNCFHNDAPNPNYEATEELPVPELPSTDEFNFDPNTCQRTVMTPYSARQNRERKEKKLSIPKKVDINFPPGRPTETVIQSLCRNQKHRPFYNIKCLPKRGYKWLARQAKTVNWMEKGFKRCCKKRTDVLICAEQKWREELNKFCLHKSSDEASSRCCSGDGANDRYSCFQSISADPHYNMTSAIKKLTLPKVCDMDQSIKNKLTFGLNVLEICCPLSGQDQDDCFWQRLQEMAKRMCLRRLANPALSFCCSVHSDEAPKCIAKFLIDTITNGQKKKCPIS
ncbi:hypothetical protein PAMA_015158 [Pampus argenteus]